MAEYFEAPYPGALDHRRVGAAQGRALRGRRGDGARLKPVPAPAAIAASAAPAGRAPRRRCAASQPAGRRPAGRGEAGRARPASLQDLWLLAAAQLRGPHPDHADPRAAPGDAAQVEGRVEAVERGFRYRPQLKVAIGDDSRHPGAALLPFPRRPGRAVPAGARVRCYGDAASGPAWAGDGASQLPGARRRRRGRSRRGGSTRSIRRSRASARRAAPLVARRWSGCRTRTRARAAAADDAARELRLPSLRSALLTVHRPRRRRCRRAAGRDPSGAAPAGAGGTAGAPPEPAPAADRLQRMGAPPLDGAGVARAPARGAAVRADRGAGAGVRRGPRDLARDRPMLRLVQGDVGSGKTVVAAMAALLAVEPGPGGADGADRTAGRAAPGQPARLAGTARRAGRWLAGKVKGARARCCWRIAAGEAQLVVGTHALMQEAWPSPTWRSRSSTSSTASACTSAWRCATRAASRACAGAAPAGDDRDADPAHAGDGAYADLDVSVIDELPPGRTPVQTVVLATAPAGDRRAHPRACARGAAGLLGLHADRGATRCRRRPRRPPPQQLRAALPELRVGSCTAA
jgi:ATP-dependent DNA helicase RecG